MRSFTSLVIRRRGEVYRLGQRPGMTPDLDAMTSGRRDEFRTPFGLARRAA